MAAAAAAAAGGMSRPRVFNFPQDPVETGAAPRFGDYKAMVCVFLYGGNDSHNMMVPISGDSKRGYAPYAQARRELAVENQGLSGPNLRSNNLSPGAGNPYHVDGTAANAYRRGSYRLNPLGISYGVNAVMPELAQLFAEQRASLVTNVGTLVEPTTRADVLNKRVDLPLFLYAHDHQQRQLQTGQAGNLTSTGWAGKIADQWAGVNRGNPLGLNVSYFGNDHMLIGRETSPIVLTAPDPPAFIGLNSRGSAEERDRVAMFRALAGEQGSGVNVDFGPGYVPQDQESFDRLFAETERKAGSVFEGLGRVWQANSLQYARRGSYGESLFDVPDAATLGFQAGLGGKLIKQFEAVAKMVHLGATGKLGPGYERQVFFVLLGGFDTHLAQALRHPLLLRELSLGMWKFQLAMEELGHTERVTSFTMSDFSRTLTQNWDGTDHAWGGHSLVFGGSGTGGSGQLRGGEMFGLAPSLVPGGADDAEEQGRLIPTISQDQVNASICDWFGVPEAQVAQLFPNLTNFRTGPGLRSAYLDLFG